MDPNVSMVVNEKQWEWLQQRLLAEAPREGVAFLLCAPSRGVSRFKLLARDLVLPAPEHLSEQSGAGVGVKRAFLADLIRRCQKEHLHLVSCHSHHFADRAWFSGIDDAWDRRLGEYIGRTCPEVTYTSVVIARKSFDARTFDARRGILAPLRQVMLTGRRLSCMHPASSPQDLEMHDDRFGRQRVILDPAGQAMLKIMVIVVVGLGGTGCSLVQALDYLGARKLILVDPDRVENTNLNRLVGAGPQDAVRRTPKVRVAARMARRIAPGTQVFTIQKSAIECPAHLKDADIIIGCVDSELMRAYLMRFPAQHLIPLIDVATGITVHKRKITEFYGQVRVVLPEGPCFHCSQTLDQTLLREEMLPPEQREAEQHHGYIQGANVPAPAVVSLNGTLSQLAVTEFINLLSPFRQSVPLLYYDGMKTGAMVYGIDAAKREDCPVCGWDVFAAGDNVPLPVFHRTAVNLPPPSKGVVL